jgi:alpha-N-acetylglucosamine transferase
MLKLRTVLIALILLVCLSTMALHHYSTVAQASDDDDFADRPSRLEFLSNRTRSTDVAIVTLITERRYLVAACALGVSLRLVDTSPLVVALLSGRAVGDRELIANLTLAGFDATLTVPPIKNPARKFKQLPSNWFKLDIFTKFRVFQLFQFRRVLFLDADLVVRRNIDHLFASNAEASFGFVPELMYHSRCETPGHERYFFDDLGARWCHGHTLEPYHGEMLRLSNTGVMLLSPSQTVFDALLELLAVEPSYNDTCIGLGGFCQDQRLINIFFNRHAYAPLSLTYNAFCQKLLTDDGYRGAPQTHVVHYRGGKQPMKPWIDDASSSFCTWFWQDHCGAFVDAIAEYERRALLAAQPWTAWNETRLRETLRAWRRARAAELDAERISATARQFAAMQVFRDEFYNGIRHIESHWHSIMTAADAAPQGIPPQQQAPYRYLAIDATDNYVKRMRAALLRLHADLKQQPAGGGDEPLAHPQLSVAQRTLLQKPAPALDELDRGDGSSTEQLRGLLARTAESYPMYVIAGCAERNDAKRAKKMRETAEAALEVVQQMFARAALRTQNATAFGGKIWRARRQHQSEQIEEVLVDLKRALNWDR